MKVDKAVCTDTMTDAENAISYENLLSTLLQRKILAIKRDCEAKKVEKQRRKQQTCLGSLIFGKHHERSDGDGKVVTTKEEYEDGKDGSGDGGGGGGGCVAVAVSKDSGTGDVTVNVEDDDDVCVGGGSSSSIMSGGHSGKSMVADTEQLYSSNPSISQQATATDANNSHLKDDDDDDEDKQASVSSSVYGEQIPADAVTINFSHLNEMDAEWIDGTVTKAEHEIEIETENKSGDNNTTTMTATIQTIDTATDFNTQRVPITSSSSTSEPHEMRINLIETVPLPTPTQCDSGSGGSSSTGRIERDIESLSPSATVKSSPTTPPTITTAIAMGTGTSSKSSSIISQIEVSDECNPKHSMRTSRKSSGSDTISLATGIIKRTTSSAQSSMATTDDASPLPLHDHEPHQQQQQHHRQQISHLLEAKSISAQCSPIFAKRMPSFAGKFIFCMWVHATCPLSLSFSMQFVVASGVHILKVTQRGSKYFVSSMLVHTFECFGARIFDFQQKLKS